jgi:3-oxoacyl-(acyl-carrier-protein) synthase
MPCRPFAANRKGTVLGEGCGILSLELRQTADQRGAPYHVMITGCGSAFEAQTGAYAPTTNAVIRAMQQALASAALNPEDVDVVIAHGDGTPVGDANEIDAIHQVFSRCLDRIAVFSSKRLFRPFVGWSSCRRRGSGDLHDSARRDTTNSKFGDSR